MDVTKTQRNRILAVLFTGVLMGALDIAIIGPALPALRESFGIDDRAAAWMLGIYVLFNLIGTPLMAKLSDRYGRRTVYAADVAIFGIGSLVVAAAPTYEIVLTGRAIQGLGAGGVFPVASAVIGDVFPPERRGAALGLIGAVFGVAFLLGPILGGVLLLLSWHWLFLINLPIAVVVVVAALRILPAARAEEPRPFDWAGMGVLAVMLTALALALNRIDATAPLSSLTGADVLPFLLTAAVLALAFPWVEERARDPVIRPGLFRNRQIVIASGLSLGAGVSEAAVVFVPALLVAAFDVSTSTAAFMLLPIVVAMAIGSPLLGRLLDRAGSRLVVVVSTALIAVGMGMVAFFTATLALFYTAGILIGVGMAGLLGSALRYVMLSEAPKADRGAAQGILTVFISIGQLAGAAVLGAIIASTGGEVSSYADAFLVVAVLTALLTVAAFGLRGRAAERRRME
ncbi:MAG: MFS transporter [Longimicrobiales bacterium]|nr:MFS transporter [Longimicrobiales bacterium]